MARGAQPLLAAAVSIRIRPRKAPKPLGFRRCGSVDRSSMLRQWAPFEELAKAFAEGVVCLRAAGLVPAAPALAIVRGLADAHRWTQDLKFFGASVAEFPEAEPRLWRGGHHREADAERAVICRRLLAGEPLVVVATPAALDVALPDPGQFTAATLRLAAGDSLDRELLIE